MTTSTRHTVDVTHDDRSDHDRLFHPGNQDLLHPVSDLAAAKAVYTALIGVQPKADAPYYVGYEAEGQHIGLVPNGGPQGMTSPVAYWHVADIEAKLAEVTAAGATVKEPRATSVAAGWWPPSPTPTATSSGWSRTGECRTDASTTSPTRATPPCTPPTATT